MNLAISDAIDGANYKLCTRLCDCSHRKEVTMEMWVNISPGCLKQWKCGHNITKYNSWYVLCGYKKKLWCRLFYGDCGLWAITNSQDSSVVRQSEPCQQNQLKKQTAGRWARKKLLPNIAAVQPNVADTSGMFTWRSMCNQIRHFGFVATWFIVINDEKVISKPGICVGFLAVAIVAMWVFFHANILYWHGSTTKCLFRDEQLCVKSCQYCVLQWYKIYNETCV